MAADIASDLAPAGRKAEHRNVAKVERLDHCGQIVGIVIHVIAVPRLAGAAMPAPIMRNDPEPLVGEEERLVFPAVRTQRPTVAERDDGTGPGPPILVVELHAIAGGDRVGGCPALGHASRHPGRGRRGGLAGGRRRGGDGQGSGPGSDGQHVPASDSAGNLFFEHLCILAFEPSRTRRIVLPALWSAGCGVS